MEPACGQHGRPKLDPLEEIFSLLPIHSVQMTRETSQLLSHMQQKVVQVEQRLNDFSRGGKRCSCGTWVRTME